MTPTTDILKQIEQVGYFTAERNEGRSRVIVAEPAVDIDPAKRGSRRFRQMVRIDGTNEASRNRAARQLALMCGINLQ
jgi:hypothetical protein